MNQRFLLLLCLFLLVGSSCLAQLRVNGSLFMPDSVPNRARTIGVNSFIGGGYVISMTTLGLAWYADEDLGSFHFFDDSFEWKQMDKMGHAYGSFLTSSWFMGLNQWAGMPRRKAIVLGSLQGFLSVSSIELFDAFGETWGFSWSDVAANATGASLAVLNESLWGEQRIMYKWNYLPSPYAGDPDFERLFGNNFAEWLLKDYNGQSYWLSLRVHSFLPESSFKDHYPKWLNLAVGYGAYGLEGGYDDPNGSWTTREYRQFYLSLDFDTSQIHTRSQTLNFLLGALNYIRIPLPTVRFDKYGVGMEAFR
ncbi:MAG: YfiM family protein [Bacteroidia bacterium]|nr:YfiM family protein [Bacteroidia bacterium]